MASFLDTLRSAVVGNQAEKNTLSPAGLDRGWLSIVSESFSGAWQRGVRVDRDSMLAFHAAFACMTLIANDIAKVRLMLVAKDSTGVWLETSNPAYDPVLRKPNHYQTRIQFFENWVLSKLSRGNAYILKKRDNRGVVNGLYVLDPIRVRPMISDSGEVYYEARDDDLTGIQGTVLIPASEIIHDRFNCLFHPLVGLSPIYACGLAAEQGLRIQANSTSFFANASTPGGILTAPGRIPEDKARDLKRAWEENYSKNNSGRVAVLGDGLKFEAMTIAPSDAQMVEQLRWTAEVVCSTFHVPPYKIGVGDLPSYNNVQSLNVEYYSQCLQILIESIEVCLDEGLGMATGMGVEFDLADLLRMDSVTQFEVLDKARNIMTPNEARKRANLPPTPGGDAVYRQQQDYSLEALARRDAQEALAPATPATPAVVEVDDSPDDIDDDTPDDMDDNDDGVQVQAARALIALQKGLANV